MIDARKILFRPMGGLVLSLALMVAPLSSRAAGDATKGKTVFQKCVSCHGMNGEGKQSQKAPRLAGQHDWYIVTQLKNFKEGKRSNPPMLPFIKNLTPADFEDVAAYLSSLK